MSTGVEFKQEVIVKYEALLNKNSGIYGIN